MVKSLISAASESRARADRGPAEPAGAHQLLPAKPGTGFRRAVRSILAVAGLIGIGVAAGILTYVLVARTAESPPPPPGPGPVTETPAAAAPEAATASSAPQAPVFPTRAPSAERSAPDGGEPRSQPPAAPGAPPRLERITWSATAPTATIGGRVVSPGDLVEGLRVSAIRRDEVELVDEAQLLTFLLRAEPAGQPGAGLAAGARRWLDSAPRYDAGYAAIAYPGGDLPADRGAAVDLAVRAFRDLGVDLQQEIHEDILSAPGAYGVARPDPNIDHRRVRNLLTFLERRASALPAGRSDDWRAGDLVFWDTNGDGHSDHLGILSAAPAGNGRPLVIHHHRPDGEFSGAPGEDDVLFRWPVTGHFRWPG